MRTSPQIFWTLVAQINFLGDQDKLQRGHKQAVQRAHAILEQWILIRLSFRGACIALSGRSHTNVILSPLESSALQGPTH